MHNMQTVDLFEKSRGTANLQYACGATAPLRVVRGAMGTSHMGENTAFLTLHPECDSRWKRPSKWVWVIRWLWHFSSSPNAPLEQWLLSVVWLQSEGTCISRQSAKPHHAIGRWPLGVVSSTTAAIFTAV